MKPLSTTLRWGLVLTLALTAWALLSPAPETEAQGPTGEPAPAALPPVSAAPLTAKPPHAQPLRLEPSLVDLFAAPKAAEPPPAAPPPPPPQVTAAPAPPPAPPAPVLAGQMWTPDGQWLVFVREGEQTLALQLGQTLATGYRVEALQAPKGQTDGLITLRHDATDTRLSLRVPIDNR